ncbi:general substrate transporter [Colletotrichum phormii]|uniref:General substrate transporter n=1 Tax=Colletotrichum phormii TaxID=359342 RepID=A0AAI9ZLX4_9PEZI|nr:general substrate transporter [Colletotrichum phormii]KAK1625704.1 general substrate transporter [Colletotrichum phormii]
MTSTKEHPDHLEEPPHLKVPRVTWYRHARLRSLYIRMPILMLCATINGYDGSLLNGLQTIENWRAYFNHPSGSTLGLFTAIVNIGGFSALFFSPYIADYYGRRIATAIGIVILVVGAIIQSVPSVNEGMFIGGRFLVGFGSNISIGAGPLLIMELAYPQHRGRLTVMYNSLWYVGSIIAAWTSPRWLCSKDQSGEAFEILVKYHASGNRDDPFVRAEFAEIQETIKLEKLAAETGWMVFFQTPGNRKRLMLIVLTSFFSQCSGNGLVSYYLHDILSSVGIDEPNSQSLFNGGLQIWSFLVAICFSVYFIEKLGRRVPFLIAAVGMLVVFSVWTGCSAVHAQTGNKDVGSAVLAMISLFYRVAGFAWPGLTVAYCSEILPFSIRAKGLAICLGVTALSGVLNQYVNPIGLSSLAWKFYFVYIVLLVIEVVCIWFLFVETKGPTLEEIAVLFDGKDAKVSKEAGMDGDATFEQVEVRKAVEKV